MKSQAKFNIHVVEDHNDALLGIYKDIGAKRLSFSNLTMVHFDSHPDLGIPNDFNADQIMNKDKLFDSLSIENWILPAVFAGHITQVIWVRPRWAKQIKDGLFNIVVGKNVWTGKIQCNCNEPYFLGDNLYASEVNLVDIQSLVLYVCDFDAIVKDVDVKLLDMIAAKDNNASRNIILDIDLDHFSTRDPFREMFKSSEEYELYKRVYALDLPSCSEDTFESNYEVYLMEKKAKLEFIWSCLNGPVREIEMDGSSDLLELKRLIEKYGLDAEILHSFGSGIDDCSLPHHISSDDEILTMMDQFEKFLSIYSSVPGCVTIARSSLDDYCPVDQVDSIQSQCLDRLKSHFGSERINSIEFLYEKI